MRADGNYKPHIAFRWRWNLTVRHSVAVAVDPPADVEMKIRRLSGVELHKASRESSVKANFHMDVLPFRVFERRCLRYAAASTCPVCEKATQNPMESSAPSYCCSLLRLPKSFASASIPRRRDFPSSARPPPTASLTPLTQPRL